MDAYSQSTIARPRPTRDLQINFKKLQQGSKCRLRIFLRQEMPAVYGLTADVVGPLPLQPAPRRLRCPAGWQRRISSPLTALVGFDEMSKPTLKGV